MRRWYERTATARFRYFSGSLRTQPSNLSISPMARLTCSLPNRPCVNEIIHCCSASRESREAEQQWMISLTQGRFCSEQVRRAIGDIDKLLGCVRNEPLKY